MVKNQFWIVTNGSEKVGNVIADGSGFEVKLNGSTAHFKNTTAISKQAHIEFQPVRKEKLKKEVPFSEEAFAELVPLSPAKYRETHEHDLNEVRVAAGLPTKAIYERDDDIKQYQPAAGIKI